MKITIEKKIDESDIIFELIIYKHYKSEIYNLYPVDSKFVNNNMLTYNNFIKPIKLSLLDYYHNKFAINHNSNSLLVTYFNKSHMLKDIIILKSNSLESIKYLIKEFRNDFIDFIKKCEESNQNITTFDIE
jgi:hypothetical protein